MYIHKERERAREREREREGGRERDHYICSVCTQQMYPYR